MARTVAVTGATGFIGGHIARALAAAGWRVRALTRRLPIHPALAQVPIEVVIGDLADGDSLGRLLAGAEAAVHAAGLTRARRASDFLRVNADGVAALVRCAARMARPPRFLLLSSLAAREPGLSAYAASKERGEAALRAADKGLVWTILRPPAV
jgi:nucleoside-diphosphate-sugar epimerase